MNTVNQQQPTLDKVHFNDDKTLENDNTLKQRKRRTDRLSSLVRRQVAQHNAESSSSPQQISTVSGQQLLIPEKHLTLNPGDVTDPELATICQQYNISQQNNVLLKQEVERLSSKLNSDTDLLQQKLHSIQQELSLYQNDSKNQQEAGIGQIKTIYCFSGSLNRHCRDLLWRG